MIDCLLVDVFAREPGAGNPAGVVPAADGLTAPQMQRIATRLGVPDTAFVTREDEGLAIRWFTPTCEINLCGHATIAAAHVLGSDEELRFRYTGGELAVTAEAIGGELLYWLARPAPELWTERRDLAGLLAALGDPLTELALPLVTTPEQDLLVPLRDAREVAELRPDMPALTAACEQLELRGVCCLAVPGGDGYEIRTRFFAPRFGIPEDPATGSVHGAVAVYLFECGLVECFPEELRAQSLQGDPHGRQGVVWLRLKIDEAGRPAVAVVGGQALTHSTGTIDPD